MLHQLSVFGAISPNTFNSAVRKRRHPHIFSVSTLYQQIIEYSRRAAIPIIKKPNPALKADVCLSCIFMRAKRILSMINQKTEVFTANESNRNSTSN